MPHVEGTACSGGSGVRAPSNHGTGTGLCGSSSGDKAVEAEFKRKLKEKV